MRIVTGLTTAFVILVAGFAGAAPVNTTNTTCECYFDDECPDTADGMGTCFYGVGCSETTRGPIQKRLDGMCGTIGFPGEPSAGSSCGAVSPGAVAKVLKAWTTAFDRAGSSGGGPVGTFSVRPYRLSHVLIPSLTCRFEIARKALDIQVLSRTLDFLQHPGPHHGVEDHSVQDISADRCRQQLGKIASRAAQLEIVGDPARAAEQLSQIPAVCPGGQTLSPRCEGAPDEIACLGERLHVLGRFFTTQPRDICGDGIVASDEQCELDIECGDDQRCLQCRCVTTACGLALCGNGTPDPGEQCDDGNTEDGDPCVSCRNGTCGDGIVCSHPSCTSGRDGGPEQCDPPAPDSAQCLYSCLPDCSCEVILE